MTDINENKNLEDVSFDATRRKLLKKTASVAGVAAVAPAITFAGTNAKSEAEIPKSAEDIQVAHERFVAKVLNKYASKSKRIKPEYIDGFAKGFVKLNGDIDYRETFKGLGGEYRLVKLFIRSVNSSRLPA